jgi:hypothetical protein
MKNKRELVFMKKVNVLILTLILSLLLGAFIASAKHNKKHTTPYGDYCSRVSHYGMHHGMLNNNQVEEALKHYYGEKGLGVEIVSWKGRFIKALIKDQDSVVDTIIFDRHTGRIRSIY